MSTRRSFIARTLAASTGMLTCCRTLDKIKAPETERPPFIVDTHCHIFNADDIDTFGYIAQAGQHALWRKVLEFPLTALEKGLSLTLSQMAPGMKREQWLLDRLIVRIKADGKESMKDPDYLAYLLKVIGRLDPQQRERSEQAKKIIDGDAKLYIKNGAPGFPTETPGINPLRSTGLLLARTAPGGFIDCMANYRIYNAIRLMQRYAQVDLFVAATLDYDTWFHQFGRHGKFGQPLLEQAEVMRKISVITRGRVMHRTGFCPLRQAVYEHPDRAGFSTRDGKVETYGLCPVDVVKESALHFGSLGAKLYPVLGFRPTSNKYVPNRDFAAGGRKRFNVDDPSRLTAEGMELGGALDRAMDKLYALCEDGNGLGLSIMSHTSLSHGPSEKSMDRTHPVYWNTVCTEHPKLRVDLSHFGGFFDGKDANADANHPAKEEGWPIQIAEFMTRHPNMYADISCYTPGNGTKATADLLAIQRDHPAAFKVLMKRLMYGTDWHENLFPLGAHGYLDGWHKVMQSAPVLKRASDDFFGNNALRFLGLTKGSPTLARTKTFFERYEVQPTWWGHTGDSPVKTSAPPHAVY